jgi:hypothetical protein
MLNSLLLESSNNAQDEQEIRMLVQSTQETFIQEKHQGLFHFNPLLICEFLMILANKFTLLCEEIVQKREDKSLALMETMDFVKLMVDEQRAKIERTMERWQAWERKLAENKNRSKLVWL